MRTKRFWLVYAGLGVVTLALVVAINGKLAPPRTDRREPPNCPRERPRDVRRRLLLVHRSRFSAAQRRARGRPDIAALS